MADSPKSIARRKWGRFLPHQRANVDHVARAMAVSNKQWRSGELRWLHMYGSLLMNGVSGRVARFLNSLRQSSRRVS